MAKEPIKVDIEGWTFEYFPMNPRECLKITTRIIRLLGEPFGALIDSAAGAPGESFVKKVIDGKLGKGGIQAAFKAMSDRLEEDEVWKTAAMLMEKVHGQAPGDKGTHALDLDLDFNGEFSLFLKALQASFEVNLGGFFQGALGGLISKTGASTATEPKTGT